MAAVTLSDQMGAMAHIDKMRHKNMLVQEHLDLPARIEEASRRIREYYQSQNIAVDDAMVQEGVRAYFDKRLTFSAPELSKSQAAIANLYITRAKWQKKAAMTSAAAALVLGGAVVGHEVIDTRATYSVETGAKETTQTQSKLLADIEQAKQKLALLSKRAASGNVGSAMRILTSANPPLEEAKRFAAVSIPAKINSDSREEASRVLTASNASLVQAGSQLAIVGKKIAASEDILDVRDQFNTLTTSKEYTASRDKYPALVEAERTAQRSIQNATEANVLEVKANVAGLGRMASSVSLAEELIAQLAGLEKEAKAMGLPREDMDKVSTMLSNGFAYARELKTGDAQNSVTTLSQTLNFAAKPLTYRVVDRVGTKSLQERIYGTEEAKKKRASSKVGSSYYAIVEAVDASGSVVAVPVTSTETGRKAFASVFGVRIPESLFRTIFADKKADGHIDSDRVVGMKPANALTPKFSRTYSAQPDMILEW